MDDVYAWKQGGFEKGTISSYFFDFERGVFLNPETNAAFPASEKRHQSGAALLAGKLDRGVLP
jgi:hypothetical protein